MIKIAMPIPAFAGSCTTVVIDTAQQATTNSAVLTG
jgi:hypothetical protein